MDTAREMYNLIKDIAEDTVASSGNDRTVYGVITKAESNGTYTVRIGGVEYGGTKSIGNCLVGLSVPVLMIGGDINNRIILYSETDKNAGKKYKAGNGIDITGATIAAKVDGDTVFFNEDGELSAAGGGGATYYAGAGLNLNSETHTFGVNVDDSTIKIDDDNKLYSTAATPGAGVITVNQNGANKGQFNVNQTTDTTINLVDTTYSDVTTTEHGLMLAVDKTKLDNIEQGAQKNKQSDWTQSDISADDYIKNKPTIPAAANNGKLTITQNGTSKGTFTANQSSNATIALTDTTYSEATTTTPGLMSVADKTKLDGIAEHAQVNVQSDWDATSGDAYIKNKPTIPAAANDGVLTITQNGTSKGTFTANASTNKTIALTDTTYSDATTSTHGLMSTADKTKLDGIQAGAKVNVQSDWNATSGDAFIKNKPTIPSAANDGILTITQNGTSKGTFSANQSSNNTIALTDTQYYAGMGLREDSNEFSVIGYVTQVLTATTDFNEVLVNGVYECPSASPAETYHRPTTAYGILDVKTTTDMTGLVLCVQTFHRAGVPYNESYIRRKYLSDDWSSWASIINKLGTGLKYQSTGNNAVVDFDAVQAKLTAGENITISGNTISATNTSYTAGENITITNNVIAAKDTTYNDVTTSAHGLMTAADKTKLNGIAAGAEVNVQSDWNQTTTTADDYIKNKPTIPAAANDGVLTITQNGTSKGTFSANASANKTIALTDTTYSDATTSVHGLMSTSDKTKLDGIAAGAEVNVQSDWNQTTTTADDYIKNKPTIPEAAKDGVLTVTQNGTSVGTFSANQSADNTIALTDTTYIADEGISISSSNRIGVNCDGTTIGLTKDNKLMVNTDHIATKTDLTNKQDKLTAGDNITISGQTISATDTTYTAGDNITITDKVIAATDTTYTAGNGIKISSNAISKDNTIVTRYMDSDLTDMNNLISPEFISYYGNMHSVANTPSDVVDANGYYNILVVSSYNARRRIQFLMQSSTSSLTGGIWQRARLTDTTWTEWRRVDLKAGDNITIGADGTIAATDTTYTAGSNVTIDGTTINATDTTYTAGSGIDITNNVISATGGGGGSIPYAECSTPYKTAAKTITIPGFELTTGSIIAIKFANSNTSTTATLSINGGTAYPIMMYGTSTPTSYTWRAGAVELLTFDGTNFIIAGKSAASTQYYGLLKLNNTLTSTSTGVAATANMVKTLNDTKQNNLTAGTGIKIENDVISLDVGTITSESTY